MAWRFEVQIPKTLRLVRGRIKALVSRWPALRRWAPLGLSLGANFLIALLLISFTPARQLRGLADAPLDAVEVSVIQLSALPETETSETEAETPETSEPEKPLAEAETAREEEPQEAPAPEQEESPALPLAPPPVATGPSDIDVPEIETARGTPDGLVALNCDREFEDRQRAAECAGAEIRSDWRAAYETRDNEQWAAAAERLRTGRYRGPFEVGPDQYGRLRENEELYQPRDPRFRAGPGPSSGGGGANYAAAFDSPEEYQRFLSTYDSRKYVGQNQGLNNDTSLAWPEPLSGWRPSWQLREDPHIDNKQMEEFLEELEDQ